MGSQKTQSPERAWLRRDRPLVPGQLLRSQGTTGGAKGNCVRRKIPRQHRTGWRGDDDVDDDLTCPQDRIGPVFHRERRSERLEHSSLHCRTSLANRRMSFFQPPGRPSIILGLSLPPSTRGTMSDPHQKALGDFLRARRAALDPKILAVAAVRQRRTPGLRRDEVAQRAGISIDWYVRLEQGRSVSPSMATIDALARALCLNTAEHAHLRALAHGPQRHRFVKEQIPATLDRLIGSLNQPAYVTGRRWDLLTWNAAAA